MTENRGGIERDYRFVLRQAFVYAVFLFQAATCCADASFSFVYNGISSTQFLNQWVSNQTVIALDPQRTQQTTVYTDPSTGLRVTCQAVEYSDFPAEEWVLYFENTGASDTPILEQVNAADVTIGRASAGEFTLYYAKGSSALVNDFQPFQTQLPANTNLYFAPAGGRSSQDTAFPYYNIARPEGGGQMLAFGWSGQWSATFARDAATNLNIKAGMQLTHLILHPGEKIRTPSILMMPYAGNRMNGHNRFRQLMVRHFTPTVSGQPVVMPIAASPHSYIALGSTTEANMVQTITNIVYNHFPVDTYWIDAGWFYYNNIWEYGSGNWYPDPARYPHGMKPVANAAHTNGMKFLLWFDLERVMPNTALFNAHPEWLLSGTVVIGSEPCYLLNLGNPAALNWAKTNFDTMIHDIGIDVFRHDMNMEPLTYWRGNDPTNRQGITEINYITGLYSFFDYLRSNNPSLLLDNSSAAGHRLDMEMARRCVPLNRSDGEGSPIPDQCMEYALAFWLPYQGLGSPTADPYEFRSGMGAAAVYFFPGFGNPNDPSWATGTYEINQYKSVRDFYLGDFYPLTPYDSANTVWLAYQFNRPDLNGGVVHLFRRDANLASSLAVQLQGLDPSQTYDLQDFDRGGLGWYAGSNLMSTGLTIQLNPQQAAVLFYTKAEGVQVSATATPQAGLAPLSVQFTAAGVAASGNPVTYAWTFGDGSASTSQNPTHTYGVAGRYTAQVTAADGLGATNTMQLTVLVARPQNSMKIAFAGYAPVEPLTNFPVLLVFGTNLSANGFSYSQVKSPDGWDVVFMNSNQTQLLNYEIEKWDTNGSSYVWVQVPLLTSNAFIQAYWGDTNLASAPLPAATNGLVWANGYAGVWHLGEASGTPHDSTQNRVAGTVVTTYGPSTQGVKGMIGSGCAFGGGYLAASAADLPAGANPRTVSTWFMKTSASTASPGEEIVGYGDNLLPGDRFGLWLTGNGVATALGLEDQGVARSFAWTWDPGWHFLAAVLPTGQTNLSGVDLYYDGKIKSSASGSGPLNTLPDELCLAGVPGYHTSDVSYNFPGVLDEVRISSVARSAAWLRAEYLTVVSNAFFNSYGPVTLYSPPMFPARLTAATSSGNAVITWPANVAPGAVLQQSPDLVHWTNSTATVVLSGTNNTVDLPLQQSKAFYRLAY